MLAHVDGAQAALREKLLKLLLVKLDDQCFSRRLEDLIVTLRYCLLGVEETFPNRVAILLSIDNTKGKTYKILKKCTSN